MTEDPLFRVVRGTPTPEELAAIVGVLWSRRQTAALTTAPAAAPSRWRASAMPRAGRLPAPGVGAWRSAG